MADIIGCSPQYVYCLVGGVRTPPLKTMRIIMKVTNGEVMPNDWL